MKKLALAICFLSISLQPLYAEFLSGENTYANNLMAPKTYFAGASSIEKEENLVRKPASIEKKAFYQKYMESKEDRFGYIFQK
jgi:hypothetical protein